MTDDEKDTVNDDAASEETSEESAENPLHKKLGIRPGLTGAVVAPPEEDLLSPLPESFVALASFDELAATNGPFDYVHFFAHNRADVVEGLSPPARQARAGREPVDLLDQAVFDSRRRWAPGRPEREHHPPDGLASGWWT